MVVPGGGADGFGIPLVDPGDLAYGRIKGIRDIFSGLVLLRCAGGGGVGFYRDGRCSGDGLSDRVDDQWIG